MSQRASEGPRIAWLLGFGLIAFGVFVALKAILAVSQAMSENLGLAVVVFVLIGAAATIATVVYLRRGARVSSTGRTDLTAPVARPVALAKAAAVPARTVVTLISAAPIPHEAAEQAAAAHMRTIGYPDARWTGRGADGGIDVASREAVAQVKWLNKPVGSEPLQRLRGTAYPKTAVFYSLNGYTEPAKRFAIVGEVALFTLRDDGGADPANQVARVLLEAARGRASGGA